MRKRDRLYHIEMLIKDLKELFTKEEYRHYGTRRPLLIDLTEKDLLLDLLTMELQTIKKTPG